MRVRGRGVDSSGGAASVILREVQVLVGGTAIYLGFEGSYLGGRSD